MAGDLLQIYTGMQDSSEKEVKVSSFGVRHPNTTVQTGEPEDAALYRYQVEEGLYKFWHYFNDSVSFDAKMYQESIVIPWALKSNFTRYLNSTEFCELEEERLLCSCSWDAALIWELRQDELYSLDIAPLLRESEKEGLCSLELAFSGDRFVLNRGFLE